MDAFRFFVSYAHADASDDNLLRDFYIALSGRVKGKIAATEEGFFDEASIPVGGTWPRTLEGALRSTQSMLSFYSPAYFNSKSCGKEVKAFQLRLEKYRRQYPASDPLLHSSILWESGLDVSPIVPPSLASVQYGVPHDGVLSHLNRTNELNAMMKERGLRSIMQRRKASDEDELAFDDIVERYAAYIKKTTAQFDLSACDFPGTFNDLQNDFPIERQPSQAAGPTPGTYGKGPKFARLLFIVGKADAFATVQERKNLSYYDTDERLWKPFLPGSDDPIAALVQGVIASEKMVADWVKMPAAPDAATFRKIIDQANADKNVLVVIVDPWCALLRDLEDTLDVLDKTRLPYGAMFLPWNNEDEETKLHSNTLREKLAEVFEALTAENKLDQVVFHSWNDLDKQLRATLAGIKKRIVDALAKEGQIRRLPPGTSLPSPPVPVR